jgi:hypothetical protein
MFFLQGMCMKTKSHCHFLHITLGKTWSVCVVFASDIHQIRKPWNVLQNKLWMQTFINKTRSACNFLKHVIGKFGRLCTFLWHAKLCKGRKNKRAHNMQSFRGTNRGQSHFNFKARGCQYIKGPQLQVVHQSRTIISSLYINWCYILNTKFIRTSIDWFHQNMKSEYKMYIN